MASLNVPLSYRDIIRVANRHEIKLTPDKTVRAYPKCCVIAAIAYDNGEKYNENVFQEKLAELDKDTYLKLKSIEVGFEGDDFFWDADCEEDETPNPRYVAIGKRLREYTQRV